MQAASLFAQQEIQPPMSIRFAAPDSACRVRMSRAHVQAIRPFAANDDGSIFGRSHLQAALRHFAQHGLSAAQHAREQAIAAGRKGDRQTFEWWLEICRALDRGMARQINAPGNLVTGTGIGAG